jgi:hypothetical protein
MITPLLDGVSLDGGVVTADALHTQRATADYVHGRGADFAFPVKHNQPGLFDALDALPRRDIPVTHTATDRGHGRITTRTIQVMDAPPDLPFPHVSQAYLIERLGLGCDDAAYAGQGGQQVHLAAVRVPGAPDGLAVHPDRDQRRITPVTDAGQIPGSAGLLHQPGAGHRV